MDGRAHVLVVDDEPDILVALKAYLEGALGVDVTAAASGPEALLRLRGGLAADLIISDYRMPAMTGLDFLLQARALAPDVPRILLTAFPDMQLAIKAVNEAAIVQFLTKPVQPEALLDLVRGTLEETRRARGRDAALRRSVELARRRAAA